MTEQPSLDHAALAELLGEVQPASDSVLLSFAEAVRDRREHEHPEWEDIYCANLAAYMGERVAPVLLRIVTTEARVSQLEAELRIGTPWTCHVCSKVNTRDTCSVCETNRPDDWSRTTGCPTAREAQLGEMVPCSAPRCSFGEWSSKAEERGWVQRGDGWLCVQCADAADERTEIVARIDAGTWGDAALNPRQQQLLAHVLETPGTRWTTGRVEKLYAALGYAKRGRRHNARADLHELAARDHLTVHGPNDGRYFLLVQKDGA